MKKDPKRRTAKSREWIEAECLRVANQTGRGGIQRITIRRLHAAPGKPNWKVADIIPLPLDLDFNSTLRHAIAHLPDIYHLEDDKPPERA
jgi:hypothetical protein